jgi:hypothetical protein
VTIFEPIFLLLLLIGLMTLGAAVTAVIRGRRAQAFRTLRNLGIGVLLYVAVLCAVRWNTQQRVLRVGDPWCFDDWCLTVEHVQRIPKSSQTAYDVSLRIFSQARRVSQRAKGAWIYVVDAQGRRYPPEPDVAAASLEALLGPGESIRTSRVFLLPAETTTASLITGHGFPCCYPSVIIGSRYTFVSLQ